MQSFTFHVVGLPHTQTTIEYSHCAYTQKVRKFCDMMTARGHSVYLYASEENEAAVDELIPVISKQQQRQYFGAQSSEASVYLNMSWDPRHPAWVSMNGNVIREISGRIGPQDFICLIGGDSQKQIADAFPHHITVEYGIGYTGVFSKYRVFESYAHMHYVHGLQHDDNGNFYDTVVPNYYDTDEFPYTAMPEDYFLFVGRLIDRKGWHIAQQVCEKLGKRLIIAGQGEFSGYGEYAGVIGVEERGRLMSHAKAVFVPTTYLEPFGGVHAEALLCGTPVITTNFGVFTETVINGVNGYRCDTFRDFVAAAKACERFTPGKRQKIRHQAQRQFSMDVVAKQYDGYFKQLHDLWGKGWYA